MRWSLINRHLRQAAHFRRLAAWDGSGAPGQIDPGATMMLPENAIKRAEWHENKASLEFARGVQKWNVSAAGKRANRRRKQRAKNVRANRAE